MYKIKAAQARELNKSLINLDYLAEQKQAVVGINATFFTNNGLPAGILKINNKWHDIAYKTRGAIGWNDSQLFFDKIQSKSILSIDNQKFKLTSVNKKMSSNKNILYTKPYKHLIKDEENRTKVKKLIIFNKKLTLISESIDDIDINNDDIVFAIGSNTPVNVKELNENGQLQFNVKIIPKLNPEKNWNDLENIVGGAPLLIFNNKIVDFTDEGIHSSFINEKHARTAIGLTNDNKILLLVLKEDLFGNNDGLTILELAKFMKDLDCKFALNLDGGSSSNLYVEPSIRKYVKEYISINRNISSAILFGVKDA